MSRDQWSYGAGYVRSDVSASRDSRRSSVRGRRNASRNSLDGLADASGTRAARSRGASAGDRGIRSRRGSQTSSRLISDDLTDASGSRSTRSRDSWGSREKRSDGHRPYQRPYSEEGKWLSFDVPLKSVPLPRYSATKYDTPCPATPICIAAATQRSSEESVVVELSCIEGGKDWNGLRRIHAMNENANLDSFHRLIHSLPGVKSEEIVLAERLLYDIKAKRPSHFTDFRSVAPGTVLRYDSRDEFGDANEEDFSVTFLSLPHFLTKDTLDLDRRAGTNTQALLESLYPYEDTVGREQRQIFSMYCPHPRSDVLFIAQIFILVFSEVLLTYSELPSTILGASALKYVEIDSTRRRPVLARVTNPTGGVALISIDPTPSYFSLLEQIKLRCLDDGEIDLDDIEYVFDDGVELNATSWLARCESNLAAIIAINIRLRQARTIELAPAPLSRTYSSDSTSNTDDIEASYGQYKPSHLTEDIAIHSMESRYASPPDSESDTDDDSSKVIEVIEHDGEEDYHKNTTKIPKAMMCREAIMDLGYPYEEKKKLFVLRVALQQDQLDELLAVSRRYSKSGGKTFSEVLSKSEIVDNAIASEVGSASILVLGSRPNASSTTRARSLALTPYKPRSTGYSALDEQQYQSSGLSVGSSKSLVNDHNYRGESRPQIYRFPEAVPAQYQQRPPLLIGPAQESSAESSSSRKGSPVTDASNTVQWGFTWNGRSQSVLRDNSAILGVPSSLLEDSTETEHDIFHMSTDADRQNLQHPATEDLLSTTNTFVGSSKIPRIQLNGPRRPPALPEGLNDLDEDQEPTTSSFRWNNHSAFPSPRQNSRTDEGESSNSLALVLYDPHRTKPELHAPESESQAPAAMPSDVSDSSDSSETDERQSVLRKPRHRSYVDEIAEWSPNSYENSFFSPIPGGSGSDRPDSSQSQQLDYFNERKWESNRRRPSLMDVELAQMERERRESLPEPRLTSRRRRSPLRFTASPRRSVSRSLPHGSSRYFQNDDSGVSIHSSAHSSIASSYTPSKRDLQGLRNSNFTERLKNSPKAHIEDLRKLYTHKVAPFLAWGGESQKRAGEMLPDFAKLESIMRDIDARLQSAIDFGSRKAYCRARESKSPHTGSENSRTGAHVHGQPLTETGSEPLFRNLERQTDTVDQMDITDLTTLIGSLCLFSERTVELFTPAVTEGKPLHKIWGSLKFFEQMTRVEAELNADIDQNSHTCKQWMVRNAAQCREMSTRLAIASPFVFKQHCRCEYQIFASREDAIDHLVESHYGKAKKRALSDAKLKYFVSDARSILLKRRLRELLGPLQRFHAFVGKFHTRMEEIALGVATADKSLRSALRLTVSLIDAFSKYVLAHAKAARLVGLIDRSYREKLQGRASDRQKQRDKLFGLDDELDEWYSMTLEMAETAYREIVVLSRAETRVSAIELRSVGPPSIVAGLLAAAQSTVFDSGDDVVAQYSACVAKLQYQVNRFPRKKLLHHIYQLGEELIAVRRTIETSKILLRNYARTLRPESYRITNRSRESLFTIEEAYLKRTYRSANGQLRALDDLDRRAQLLVQQVKRSVGIQEEDHGKAILIFTIVTTIFLPLSFIASFFGMNTYDIRDMSSGQWAFWAAALPFTAIIAFIVLISASKGGDLLEAIGRSGMLSLPATRLSPFMPGLIYPTSKRKTGQDGYRLDY